MNNFAAARRPLPNSPFKAPPEAPRKHFAVGDRVTHDRYGLGRVIGVEGDGDTAVLVDFGSQRVRVSPPYSTLFVL